MATSLKVLALVLLAALLCPATLHAQDPPPKPEDEDKAQPDRWRGLILDQSTPEDVIRVLGQASKDKIEGFKPYPLEKRFNLKGEFRHLQYKKLPGVESAELVFTKGKLISILLELDKSIPAAALQNIYGVEFEPKFSALSSGGLEQNRGKLFARNYPPAYSLIAKTEHSYVSAFVQIGIFSADSTRGSTGEGAFPGKTKRVQLISRSLETHEGADVLK
jgi:hypothetical protein